ncbi:MAG: PIN domain-containing protein [Bryobacterales bacterium]|nr:PIN domain-containing protein [Bryobacterales bacterium]MDE0261881.1 PIN domain-containing protein [Bryobacterales bacterium]
MCDSNVWLALVLSRHQHHRVAEKWLTTIDMPESVCFCRATQQSFLRLVTTAAVMGRYGRPPLTNRQAWALYEQILTDDRIVMRAEEPSRLEARWKSIAVRDTASPKAWMDSYLAGFALASGLGLVTTDRAFSAFPGLDLTLLAA